MLEKLRELGIRDDLIREITEYRETYPVEQEYASRIPKLEHQSSAGSPVSHEVLPLLHFLPC